MYFIQQNHALHVTIVRKQIQLYKNPPICIIPLFAIPKSLNILKTQNGLNPSSNAGFQPCIFIPSDKVSLSAVLNNILSCLYFSIVFLSLSHHIFQTSHTRPVTALAAAVGFLHTNSFSKCSSSTFAFLRFSGSGILL